MRNSRGPRIEPCGTPYSIVDKSIKDDSLFSIIFGSNFNNEPDTPFCFNLKIFSSYYTLSNALEISKNIERTSRDLMLSKNW